MATMNLSLPDPTKEWVERESRTGRYANASDCVRDLDRRDQDSQAAIAEVQQLVDEGLASGAPEPFDMEAFLKRKRAEHASRTSPRVPAIIPSIAIDKIKGASARNRKPVFDLFMSAGRSDHFRDVTSFPR